MDNIHDMCVVNTDTLSHWNKSLDKITYTAEKEKKNNILDSCLQQHCHFSPFIVSVDGLLNVELEDTIKHIANHLATKWNQPYSQTCGYVKIRMATTLVCDTHC